MYDIYEKLLKEKGLKTADVCRATGLKAPTFSDWKKGKSAPNVDKLILIAEYFGGICFCFPILYLISEIYYK